MPQLSLVAGLFLLPKLNIEIAFFLGNVLLLACRVRVCFRFIVFARCCHRWRRVCSTLSKPPDEVAACLTNVCSAEQAFEQRKPPNSEISELGGKRKQKRDPGLPAPLRVVQRCTLTELQVQFFPARGSLTLLTLNGKLNYEKISL